MVGNTARRKSRPGDAKVVGLIVLLLAGVAGGVVGKLLRSTTNIQGTDAPEERLLIPDVDLRLGDIWQQAAWKHTIRITNKSTSPIQISHFRTSCNCTNVSPPQLLLGEGERGTIHLTIRLDSAAPRSRSSDITPFEIDIIPCSGDRDALRELGRFRLLGRVIRPVRFEPAEIDFGSRSRFEQPLGSLRTTMTMHSSVHHIAISCPTQLFQAEGVRRKDDPQVYDLTVRPKERLAPGNYSFSITVDTFGAGNERFPSREFPVRATVKQDVQASQPEIVIGHAPIGTIKEEVLSFASSTGRPFKVMAVESSDAAVAIHREDEERGTNPMYRVRCKITREGQSRTIIRARIRDAQELEFTAEVPVFVHGLAR